MIVAPARPSLLVLAVVRIGRRGAERPVLVEPLGGAVAAVGIALRLDQDDRVVQLALDRRAARG